MVAWPMEIASYPVRPSCALSAEGGQLGPGTGAEGAGGGPDLLLFFTGAHNQGTPPPAVTPQSAEQSDQTQVALSISESALNVASTVARRVPVEFCPIQSGPMEVAMVRSPFRPRGRATNRVDISGVLCMSRPTASHGPGLARPSCWSDSDIFLKSPVGSEAARATIVPLGPDGA